MCIFLKNSDLLERRNKKSELGLGSAFFVISDLGFLPYGVPIKGVIEKGLNFDEKLWAWSKVHFSTELSLGSKGHRVGGPCLAGRGSRGGRGFIGPNRRRARAPSAPLGFRLGLIGFHLNPPLAPQESIWALFEHHCSYIRVPLRSHVLNLRPKSGSNL